MPLRDGRLDWKVGAYRTGVSDDIIHLASNIQGRAFFANVPATRRQGVEAGATYQTPRWMAYANYSFLDATYQFSGTIASPNNPMADDDGNIFVRPGNKIPANPAQQFKFGAEFAVTPEWKVGADIAVVGSQYFVGDDSNLNAKVPAYWVTNLRTSYQINKEVQVFAIVTNLFNQKYYTYGSYFELGGVAKAIAFAFTDPRTVTPAQPLGIYGGVKVRTLGRRHKAQQTSLRQRYSGRAVWSRTISPAALGRSRSRWQVSRRPTEPRCRFLAHSRHPGMSAIRSQSG